MHGWSFAALKRLCSTPKDLHSHHGILDAQPQVYLVYVTLFWNVLKKLSLAWNRPEDYSIEDYMTILYFFQMQSRYVQLSLHASWCIRIIRFDAVNMACPVCKLDSSKSCGQVCWILSPHCTIPFLSRYGISIPHLSQCWVPRSAFGESWPSHEPA